MLETNCAPCHEPGQERRPALGEAQSISRTTALQSAWLVALGRMPPKAGALSPAVRDRLVDELCGAAQMERAACLALADTSLKTPLVRDPQELVRAVDQIVPSTQKRDARPVENRLTTYLEPTSDLISVHLDTTLQVLVTLLADERCPSFKPDDDQGRAAFARCARAILDRQLLVVPPPRGGP
jgi:hypothetical protein